MAIFLSAQTASDGVYKTTTNNSVYLTPVATVDASPPLRRHDRQTIRVGVKMERVDLRLPLSFGPEAARDAGRI